MIHSYRGLSAEHIVMKSVICDGDPARHNRQELFSTEYKDTGMFDGPHKIYDSMCTIFYTG